MSKALETDTALALAKAVTEIVAPCLQPSEQREFFNLAFEAATAALQKYTELLRREDRRLLRPSKN